jgi:hypothetical protein
MSRCKTKKCGCIDTGLVTQPPCIHDTPECPNPDPCSETFSDCCVVHDGDGIADLNIQTGDRLCDILQKISLAISNAGGGATIESVEVIGNDLVITMSDGTVFTTALPATTVPNDPWVVFTDLDPEITSFNVNGGITTNTKSVEVAYKILGPDSGLVRVKAVLNVTIPVTSPGFNQRDIDRVLDFSLIFAEVPIGGSTWFPLQAGSFTGLLPTGVGDNFGVPVSITPSSAPGPAIDPLAFGDVSSQGRGSCTGGVGGSLIFCQSVAPKVVAGTYGFLVEWEMLCRIGHPL